MVLAKSNSGTSRGSGFRTSGNMFVRRYGTNETTFNRASAIIGVEPTDVMHDTVVQELEEAEANRALLVGEIAQAVKAALGPIGGAPSVDLKPVLDKLDQILTAIALIPTADQNGEASRRAIVKD